MRGCAFSLKHPKSLWLNEKSASSFECQGESAPTPGENLGPPESVAIFFSFFSPKKSVIQTSPRFRWGCPPPPPLPSPDRRGGDPTHLPLYRTMPCPPSHAQCALATTASSQDHQSPQASPATSLSSADVGGMRTFLVLWFCSHPRTPCCTVLPQRGCPPQRRDCIQCLQTAQSCRICDLLECICVHKFLDKNFICLTAL